MMPLMIIKTSVSVPENKKEALLTSATKVLVEAAGKKESHVMVLLEKVDASMGGKVGAVAFVEIRSLIGLTHAVNHDISERVCDLLEEMLGVPGDRIFMNFTSVPESAWGWDHGIVVWDHDQKKWVIK
jgi:phenylpyruvate tautomerase PptA (4-oxalocrotonate tautomerase family)